MSIFVHRDVEKEEGERNMINKGKVRERTKRRNINCIDLENKMIDIAFNNI